MGVIRARNRGYEISSGDICITIDDDAVFENPNVTKNIVKHFQQNQEVGIVAMRVINFFSGDIEFPHQGSHLQNKIPFKKPQIKLEDRSGHVEKTTLFMGCGNAIHRKVFEEIGRYSPIFDYGVEEFDLSLRVLDAGFDIVYDPESTVIHYESPKGRFSEKKVQKELYKNRLDASVRNHPIRYVLFSLILWTCRLLIRSNGDIVLWIKSLAEFSRYIPELLKDRDPLSEKSIRKINELNGRVY